jgi:hypothetical protein
MPYQISRDPDAALTVIAMRGAVVGDDFAAALREVAEHPQTKACRNLLWDLREMKTLAVLPEDVQHVLKQQALVETHTGAARAAIVSMHPDVSVMASLLKRSRPDTHRELRTFGRLPDARAWLQEHPLLSRTPTN